MEAVSLRRVTKGNLTRRPHWALDRSKSLGFTQKHTDHVYANAVERLEPITNLCEIGSDVGRSTAWLSEVAKTIDVYDKGEFWIELCKSQCYSHQKQYSEIRNVNWHETGDISIIQVLETLPKHYDAIKLTTHGVLDYVPLLVAKLKTQGCLILHEYGGQDLKQELVKMLQMKYNFEIKRTDLDLFVAKHK